MLVRLLVALALAVSAVVPAVGPAQAGVLDLLQPKLKRFPGCHDPKVLERIVHLFNEAEEDLWRRGLTMVSIRNPRERAELIEPRMDELDERLIPRRYCTAHAVLDDAHRRKHPRRTVLYLIEGGMGFAGTRYEVFYCITGLDPWRVYDGRCEVLRRYN